jgi:uncharacterized protein YcnI
MPSWRNLLRPLPVIVAAPALAIGLTATVASAHATAQNTNAPSGGYGYLDIRIPHGCDGQPTISVAVQIPDGVVGVKPERKAGWTTTTVKGPITPYESHGNTISEGVVEVVWTTDDPLPDDMFEDFGMSVKWPDQPGDTLYFPTVQQCPEGGEAAWIEIPAEGQDPHALDAPAPAVVLTGGTHDHGDDKADGHSHSSSEEGTDMETAAVGAPGVDGAPGAPGVDGADGSDGSAAPGVIAGLAGGVVAAIAASFALRRRSA